MSDEIELKKLLNDLKVEEIEFMSELAYNCLKAIYFDNDDLSTLETKFNLTSDELNETLSKGYDALNKIIYARF